MEDPICSMDVDEQTAAGHSEYHGETNYFCSESCKEEFDKNPQLYADEERDPQGAGQSTS